MVKTRKMPSSTMDNVDSTGVLSIAWNSIKANRLPMLVLWIVVIAISVAYWSLPAFASILEPLRRWQEQNGIAAAFTTQFVFCGVVPAIFLSTVREIKTDRHILKCCLQSVWSGCWGIVYLWFYAMQTKMFGSGHDLATLLCKTAFDEFVWTPLVPVPLTAMFFLWMGSGFSLAQTVKTCREGYFRRSVFPTLLSNWVVWIPAVAAVYAFPQNLQILVMGFVACFWNLVCLQLGRRAHSEETR